MPVVSVPHTSSNRLLLSNQDKGCTPSVAHSLPLPLGPALLNLWNNDTRFERRITALLLRWIVSSVVFVFAFRDAGNIQGLAFFRSENHEYGIYFTPV